MCVSVCALCIVCFVCVACYMCVCCRRGFKGGSMRRMPPPPPCSANAQATSLGSEDQKSTMHTLKVTIFSKLQEMGWRLGLCPRTRWGRIQHSPRPPSWILVLRARPPPPPPFTTFKLRLCVVCMCCVLLCCVLCMCACVCFVLCVWCECVWCV